MEMEIILLSIACVMNSAAIIIHLVSHIRGNRRKGGLLEDFKPSFDDLKRASEMQRFMEGTKKTADLLHDTVFKHCGVSVDVLPGDHISIKPE